MQKSSEDKSSDAFRTISEVADDLDLPQHVLRFWETRFPPIRPLKRAGGRRYYRPADVTLLRTIRQLLYDEGYTIKGVQRLLKEQGARNVSAGVVPMPVDLAETDSREFDEPRIGVGDAPGGQEPDMSHLVAKDRDAILEMLAVVDDCIHILEAFRRPAD